MQAKARNSPQFLPLLLGEEESQSHSHNISQVDLAKTVDNPSHRIRLVFSQVFYPFIDLVRQ
jgi:hypothetical protein